MIQTIKGTVSEYVFHKSIKNLYAMVSETTNCLVMWVWLL